MRTGPDGVLHLAVPVRERVGWVLLLVVIAACGLADLRWGTGAVAIACLVVVVLLGWCVLPPMAGSVTAHPEGHLVVGSPLGAARYEMEQIDSVVVDVAGPEWEGGPSVQLMRGASLVLFSGAQVPLTATQVLALPPLQRRLDAEVRALRAWLEEGPA